MFFLARRMLRVGSSWHAHRVDAARCVLNSLRSMRVRSDLAAAMLRFVPPCFSSSGVICGAPDYLPWKSTPPVARS